MLTDRQQKFYDRIVKLSENREVPRKERKFIKKAKKILMMVDDLRTVLMQ
jgi:hypothetical protein